MFTMVYLKEVIAVVMLCGISILIVAKWVEDLLRLERIIRRMVAATVVLLVVIFVVTAVATTA